MKTNVIPVAFSTPVLPKVGERVNVDWRTRRDGLQSYDTPPWLDQKVAAVRKLPTGEIVVFLQGHPCCAVRLERLGRWLL